MSWKKLQYGESFPNGHSRKRDRSTQRPPSQNPVFLNSHTKSLFLHSRKRSALATDTFFTSRECSLSIVSTMYCALYIHRGLLSSTRRAYSSLHKVHIITGRYPTRRQANLMAGDSLIEILCLGYDNITS